MSAESLVSPKWARCHHQILQTYIKIFIPEFSIHSKSHLAEARDCRRVRAMEVTHDGHLRAPVLVRIRDEKDPRIVPWSRLDRKVPLDEFIWQ